MYMRPQWVVVLAVLVRKEVSILAIFVSNSAWCFYLSFELGMILLFSHYVIKNINRKPFTMSSTSVWTKELTIRKAWKEIEYQKFWWRIGKIPDFGLKQGKCFGTPHRDRDTGFLNTPNQFFYSSSPPPDISKQPCELPNTSYSVNWGTQIINPFVTSNSTLSYQGVPRTTIYRTQNASQ